ncbi:hypothetical protein C2S52_008628 [Perilla frutescens var. hirtella]|nr:hypothetical protein C2S52_008628 [Perilla frutescens var. hirtella]
MGENINDQPYIPEVGDDRKPKIQMKFAIDNSKKNKASNEIVWKQFVCCKEGRTDETRSNKRAISGELKNIRVRGELRTNCKAKLSLVKQQTGPDWIVSTFVEGHNHALSTPSKVHLLRSHRSVSTVKRALTQQFSEANVPTCQKMRLLEIECGGPERIGCTERDIRNLEQELRDEQKGIDAETLIEFFTSEKERNSAFFFDYETDSINRLSRCFWADPTSRRAYSVFGDVIVFDSTYNTNKYGMIFALFIGVNHHHQTIIFGCGFLSGEKTESYIWLLNKWMEVMPTGPPKVIITDQDPALTKAIAQVLPQTVHRFCLWHILNKFPDKISHVTFRDHYQSIKTVIENSISVDEFEQSWKEVIECANLEQNKWIALIYTLRHQWVPIYFSHIFCAGMSSSQREESSHSFLKKYISNKNSLMDFITRFNRALRHQRHNELVADHIDMNEHSKIKTNWLMETQMVKVYTKKKWMEFQSEMSNSHGYFVQQESIRDDFMVYNVMKSQSCSSSKTRVLTLDKGNDHISCSCRKFEFEGIPCRHMLSFFRINQVFQLREKYILKRWTRDAMIGAVYLVGDQDTNDSPTKFLMSRHSRLSYKASMIIDDASLTEEGTKFLDEQFDYIHGKIKYMSISPTFIKESQRRKILDKAPNINDPSEIRTKGCGKRLPSSKEKSSLKARICHGCGRTGVSHDKRNCPNLHDGSVGDDHRNNHDNSNEEDFISTVGSNNMK